MERWARSIRGGRLWRSAPTGLATGEPDQCPRDDPEGRQSDATPVGLTFD